MVLVDVLHRLADEDRFCRGRPLAIMPSGKRGEGCRASPPRTSLGDVGAELAVACFTTPSAMAGWPLKADDCGARPRAP